VDGRRAIVRTLAFPLSFLVLGLGFLGILLGDQRRALHDVIAGTAVVYLWDARAARLRSCPGSDPRMPHVKRAVQARLVLDHDPLSGRRHAGRRPTRVERPSG
jgi:hypothetical protein